MFSRKKKKTTAEEQADLAKQLGISLPGLGDPDQDIDDDATDDALEDELLALMEEEASSPTPTAGRPTSESENTEHDEQLLAELAEITGESQETDSKPSVSPRIATSGGIHQKPPVPQPRAHNPPAEVKPPATVVAPVDKAPLNRPPAPQPRQAVSEGGTLDQSRVVTKPTQEQSGLPRDVPQEALLPQGSAGIIPLPHHRDPDKLVASVPKQPADPGDTVSLLESRIANYQAALANARANQEDSKARRYDRGLKTLKDLQRKAKAGRPIPEGDIPPEVATGGARQAADTPTTAPPTTAPSTTGQPKTPDEHTHKMLCQRRDLYKMAALKSKKEGDPQTAMEYLKIAKQFDQVISAAEAGQEVDLSNMPPPPSELKAAMGTETQDVPPKTSKRPVEEPEPSNMAAPKTVLEALLQRRERYKTMADKAVSENNSSKARRLGRIVKQYEDAIKKEKAGRPVEYAELPELPDFPPLPLKQAPGVTPATEPSAAAPPVRAPEQISPQKPVAAGQPQPPARTTPPESSSEPSPPRKSVKESMNERQLKILLERQKKVKLQALQAKQQGDMEEAKRLIIIAKGFDPMIEAAKNGMPVNMDSIPKIPDEVAPQAVSPPQDGPPIDAQVLTGDKNEMYTRLIGTLQKQIEQCQTLAKAYQELGNAQTSKRFQEYCQASQEDKDVLMMAHQHDDPVPRFHFEQRTIPTLRITPGLKKEEAEITISQGSNYKHQGASDEEIETYVKFEFPYPSDKPQVGQTSPARGAATVDYQYTDTVQVTLKARSFLSCIKRKQIKFEVIQKRGFLKGEKTLGTASLKLAELENKHEIEGTLPLCEGRREIGGTLEARVRLHHPVSGMKEEFIKEKWLVVESKVGRGLRVTSPSKSTKPATSPSKSVTSPKSANPRGSSSSQVPDTIDVLKFEVMQLKKKSDQLQAQGKPKSADITATIQNHLQTIKGLEGMLKTSKTKQAYMARLQSNIGLLTDLAREAQQQGNKEKAKLLITKKQLATKELEKLSGRR